jgi:acyl carrier protein
LKTIMRKDSVVDKLELELKKLIVDALKLEGIAPEEIDSEEPLFASGLGLDSIDALELGVALRKVYDLKIESVTEEVKQHFMNVPSLAQFIRSQQAG